MGNDGKVGGDGGDGGGEETILIFAGVISRIFIGLAVQGARWPGPPVKIMNKYIFA